MRRFRVLSNNSRRGERTEPPPIPKSRSEIKRSLRRFSRPKMNALQFEHANLRRRAAGRGEAANFTAGGQDPVTWNYQGRRIAGHCLADVARRLAAGADLLRQGAVSGRAAPADPAQGGINPAEE